MPLMPVHITDSIKENVTLNWTHEYQGTNVDYANLYIAAKLKQNNV